MQAYMRPGSVTVLSRRGTTAADKGPSSYHVVFMITTYTSFAQAKAEAPDLIAAHLARSQELHRRGVLVMAGAFLDRPEEPLRTMGILTSREAAEDYARGDPFVQHGKVTQWTVRLWSNMFA